MGRWLVVVLAVLLPAVAWGVTTASTEASFGPHVARYDVTVDHEVTIDLGPLGRLVIDSELPPPLGARVVVQEIPRDLTAVGGASTLAALGADLEGYVQFFSGPEASLGVIVRALILDALRRSVLAIAVLVGAIVTVRWLLGPRRRAELAAHLRAHRGPVAGATALALAITGTVTASGPIGDGAPDVQTASAVFEGTPLEGARLTGRLAGVIDTYGGFLVDAYRENEDFYGSAVAGLDTAWSERMAQDAELARLREEMALMPRPAPAADDESDPLVLLVVSDLHCNVGMARVIERAAELSDADIVLNAGDTTVNGTAVERYCVTAFANAVPPGAQQVVADGNHDSEVTSAQERAAGAQVLDGEVVDVGGIRILGDSDPMATRIGSGTNLVGEETAVEVGHRLTEVACTDPDGVDLLLIHNPVIGNAPLESGCVPAQVSGHVHRRVGPVPVGQGVRYVSASTAGAAHGEATVGPLNAVAELTVLRFDPETRAFLDYRLIRVHPDADVTVGFQVRWPTGPTRPPWLDGPR